MSWNTISVACTNVLEVGYGLPDVLHHLMLG
jgi:hypothetical protein